LWEYLLVVHDKVQDNKQEEGENTFSSVQMDTYKYLLSQEIHIILSYSFSWCLRVVIW
jgi:hypothetical protein